MYAFFLEVRKRLSVSYEELFAKSGEPDLSREANFDVKYGWYHSLWRLANEDITKIDEVRKLNVHKCLSALEYIKDKGNIQLSKIKKK